MLVVTMSLLDGKQRATHSVLKTTPTGVVRAGRAGEILLDTSSLSCQSLALRVTGWLPTIVLAKPCNVSCCDAQPLTEQ